MQETENRFYYYLCFFCMVIIFLFNIRNINNLDMPCIQLDEFGYWTNAILFAGKDWSNITTEYCSYYSYGYGLLLSVIVRIVDNITLAYQLAILLNAAMVSGCIIIISSICKEIIPKVKRHIIILCSFVALFYSSTLMNTQFAWSETVLLFSFLIVVLLFVKTINKEKIRYPFLLGIFTIYIYMIHQRALGVLIAVIISVLIAYIIKNVSRKSLVAFFSAIVLTSCIHMPLKDYVYENNWNSSYEVNVQMKDTEKKEGNVQNEDRKELANDYSSQLNNILFCFTLEGIQCFFIGFFGKVYYMSIASFFLVLEGFFFLIQRLKRGIRKCNIEIFLLLTMFFMLGIATVFLIYPGRIDTVIYGRYTDWILPIFIVLGLVEVVNKGISWKRLSFYVLGSTFYIILFRGTIENYNLTQFFPTCAPAGNYYRILADGTLGDFWIELMHIIHCMILIFFYIVVNIFKNKKIRIILSCLFLVPWITEANSTIENTLYIGYKEEMKSIVSEIKGLNEDEVYYLSNGESEFDLYSGSLQFLLYDTEIKCITEDELEYCDAKLVIIPNDIHLDKEKWEIKSYKHFSLLYQEE